MTDQEYIDRLCECIYYMVEYAGPDMFPAIEGWDHYDLLRELKPDMADALKREYERLGTLPRYEREIANLEYLKQRDPTLNPIYEEVYQVLRKRAVDILG